MSQFWILNFESSFFKVLLMIKEINIRKSRKDNSEFSLPISLLIIHVLLSFKK